MEDSADEYLRVSGKELVESVIPIVYNETLEKDDFVSYLLPKFISWETNVTSRYMQIRFRSSQSTHLRTDRLGFIDCLEDTLLSSSMSASSSWMKYQIRRALKGLKSCKSSLNDIVWDHDEDNELDNLVSRLTQAAYEVEYVSESFAIGDGNTWTKRLWISDQIDEIKQITMKIKDVLANKSYNDNLFTNEVVVGMEELEETVTKQLIRGSNKLGVVSIVGMGGLSKTTLAKKVFNSPSVQDSFDVRAWCTISKVYRKRDVLLEILGYFVEVPPEIRRMTDDDLSNRLRQLLVQRSYLSGVKRRAIIPIMGE